MHGNFTFLWSKMFLFVQSRTWPEYSQYTLINTYVSSVDSQFQNYPSSKIVWLHIFYISLFRYLQSFNSYNIVGHSLLKSFCFFISLSLSLFLYLCVCACTSVQAILILYICWCQIWIRLYTLNGLFLKGTRIFFFIV